MPRPSGRFDRRPLVERRQRRQEPGERLARAGRRDQQRRAPRPRLLEQLELVRPRRPAPPREPGGERARGGGEVGLGAAGDAVHAHRITRDPRRPSMVCSANLRFCRDSTATVLIRRGGCPSRRIASSIELCFGTKIDRLPIRRSRSGGIDLPFSRGGIDVAAPCLPLKSATRFEHLDGIAERSGDPSLCTLTNSNHSAGQGSPSPLVGEGGFPRFAPFANRTWKSG